MPTYEYQCPEGHALREVPEDDRQAAGQVSGLRQAGHAEDFRRRRAGVQGQRLLHHRLRQGRQGSPEGRSPRSRPPRPSPSQASQGRDAKPAAKAETKRRQGQARPRRRPPPSERRASRRAREGGLAARRRRCRVRARAAARRRPRRPRHQPRHGARQARARQPPEDGRAGARGAAAPARRSWRKTEIAGPGLHQLLAGRRTSSPSAHRRILEQGPSYGRCDRRRRAQGQRRVRLRQSRPGRSTWATAAAPRWATPSPRCSSGPGTRVTREFYINDAGVQIDRLAQSLWARVRRGWPATRPRSPRAATTASTSRENAREVLEREGAALCRPARGGGRPPEPRARAPASSAKSRTATWPSSACGSTSCRSEQAIYDSRPGRARARAAARARAHLRGRGRALAPHHRLRRRQGPGAPEERRHASPISCPTSRTTSTSTTAASTASSTSGAPTITATSPGCAPCSRPWAIRRSSSTWRWCSW